MFVAEQGSLARVGHRKRDEMTAKTVNALQDQAGLPSEADQAERFGKARSAQATAVLEDYVELIDDLLKSEGEARPTDIARRLGVSHATAIKSIARLKRDHNPEFQKFDAGVRKILSVSHDELKRREKKWKRERAEKKRAKTLPASRALTDKD